tara:strand:+ start:214 stop:708 length:495 start_codon:yes stop_codon:yes gene_type:complete
MKTFKNLFFKNKQKIVNKESFVKEADQYIQIGKLVKEARIKKNLSIEELSQISKIPKNIIISIENNLEHLRPKYPFIRSILNKLEECLFLKKNSLLGLVTIEKKSFKKEKNLILKNFDFINTLEGTVLYFLLLILIIFILRVYFISNVNIIEIQNIQEEIKEKL